MKNFYLSPIKGYQYISKLLPANCRYYPSCSEYAKWQFTFNKPHKALLSSSIRILRCNQLFEGGIDYPLVEYRYQKRPYLLQLKATCGKIDIEYWLVPKITDLTNHKYYIIKDFDAIKRST